MNYFEEYKKWLDCSAIDADDKAKLKEIENNENEIKDAFYQNLAFGTAGLRGVLGMGTNRMNKYVVRRATQGIANYISKNGEELKNRGVVIGYDSRHFSAEFALETALTLCANGVKTYLFESLRPVPEISFSILPLPHHTTPQNTTATKHIGKMADSFLLQFPTKFWKKSTLLICLMQRL